MNEHDSWEMKEVVKLRSAVKAHAPGVMDEMTMPNKVTYDWGRLPSSGLLKRVVHVRADGPRVKANLCVFGAKLAMALYREHVGVALPLDGAVWCQFTLNSGMTQEHLDERIKILPIHGTLRQGRKNVLGQFAYRYNCDERTVIAAVAKFHRGLWITLFASSDERIIKLFSSAEGAQLPGSILVRPGGLLDLLQFPTVA